MVRLVVARDAGPVLDDTAGRTGGRAAGRVVVRAVAPRVDTESKIRLYCLYYNMVESK